MIPKPVDIDTIILAGGLSTRLRERLPDVPKPLAPVGDRPFLDYQIEWLARQGVRKVVLAVHHMAEQFDDYVARKNGRPLPLATIREIKPLGTGGAIANALRTMHPDAEVLVMNGDTQFHFDIAPALSQHRRRQAIVTMIVGRVDDVARYGTVTVRNGKVTGFAQASGENRPGLVNCGAYIVSPGAIDENWTGAFSIEKDFFPKLAAENRIDAFVTGTDDSFFDIGLPESYDTFVKKYGTPQGGDVAGLIIPETADLRDAMQSLKASGRGIVVIADEAGRALGVLTDGDIRKALLKKEGLHQTATEYMTRHFVSVREGTPKEQTLKLLDARIHAIPVLDAAGRVTGIVSPGYLETRPATYARAKAPVRVSLAGGGTDFTAHFMEHGGVSLSTTLSMHAHAVLKRRADRCVNIYSHDRRQTVTLPNASAIDYDGNLDLIKAAIRIMNTEFGFDLSVSCDFPEGSGMGGSAALVAAVIGCLNEFREDKLDTHAIAEYAFEAERIELDIKGGWQDQYSTVFGGFNYIEFDKTHNMVTPLRLQSHILRELEERFLLCFSGKSHLGGVIQADNHGRDSSAAESRAFTSSLKDIAQEMRTHLLRGHLSDFGRMLDETWNLKKSFDVRVTNEDLDSIYDLAMHSGADGGRLLGTGGGGYFLFLTKPFERYRVAQALEGRGLKTQSIVLDDKGLQSWVARP